jgi:hypothetical protein
MVKMMHPSKDANYAKRETKKLMDIMDRGPGLEEADGDINFAEFMKAHR